jgi:hypothetical protein
VSTSGIRLRDRAITAASRPTIVIMNEAWIFVSIGDAGGDTDWVGLDALIRMADFNNHLVPNADELEEAISNLVAARLVEADDTRTRLTAVGRDLFREVNERPVGFITRFADLDGEWRARGYPPESPGTWTLDEETWRRAWQSYHEWAMRNLHAD